MNKSELIGAIAEKSGLSKKDAEKALNAMVDSVGEALKAGDKVLCRTDEAGRHFGMRIKEDIQEK